MLFILFWLACALFHHTPFLTSSISQKTGAESKARAERIEQIQTELENLKHQISTLGQQIDQYHHAISRAKEEQGKMR